MEIWRERPAAFPVFCHYIRKAVKFIAPEVKDVIFADENPCLNNQFVMVLNPFIEIPEGTDDPLKYLFQEVMGIAGHELGHYWWSNFAVLKELDSLEKIMSNIIEDAAVNRALTYCEWPGLGRLVHLHYKRATKKEYKHLPFTLKTAIQYLIQKVIYSWVTVTFEDEDAIEKMAPIAEILYNGTWQSLSEDRTDFAKDAASLLREIFPDEKEELDEPKDFKFHDRSKKGVSAVMPFPAGMGEEISTESMIKTKTTGKAVGGKKSDDASDSVTIISEDEEDDSEVGTDGDFSSIISDIIREVSKREKEVLPSETWDGSHSGVTVKVFRPEILDAELHRKSYLDTVSAYSGQINTTASAVVKSIKTERDEWLARSSGKILDIPRITSGKRENPFRRKNQYGDTPEVAFTFLIDESGSMSTDIYFCRQGVSILGEMLRKANVPFAVIGHGAMTGELAVGMRLYKSFSACFAADFYQISDININSEWIQNRDGLAIRWTGEYIAKNSPRPQNILMVLSDGVPYHSGTSYEYGYPDVDEDMKKQIKRIEAKGISVFGIGYRPEGVAAVRKYYKKTIMVENPKDLLPATLKLVKTFYPAAEG